MLNLLAALALTFSAAGAAGQDEPDDYSGQWGCSVVIYGSKGSSVMVSLHQTGRGTLLSRSLGWSPPVVDQFAPRDPRPEAPELTVFYALTEQGEIGSVDTVLGSATSVGGPAATLGGAKLSISLDGEGPWTTVLSARAPGPDYRLGPDLVRHRSAFFEVPELPGLLERGGVVTLSLLDADGYLAGQTEYDLTYTGERAHLFAEARDKVMAMMRLPVEEALVRHPESCTEAMEGPVPDFEPRGHVYELLPAAPDRIAPSDPGA